MYYTLIIVLHPLTQMWGVYVKLAIAFMYTVGYINFIRKQHGRAFTALYSQSDSPRCE